MTRLAGLRGARWLFAVGATAWLAGCGGGGSAIEPPVTEQPPPTAGGLALVQPQPGELVDDVRRILRARSALGTEIRDVLGRSPIRSMTGTIELGNATTATGRSTGVRQEAGVDEPDLIQSDGQHLYSLQVASVPGQSRLQVHRRLGDGALQPLGTQPLPAGTQIDPQTGGLLLHAAQQALAVLGVVWQGHGDCVPFCAAPMSLIGGAQPDWQQQWVAVQRFSLADAGAPVAGKPVLIEGEAVAARRVGDNLILVTVHHPWLRAETLPGTPTPAEREAAITALTAAELLPRVRVDGQPERPLVTDGECWLQRGNTALDVVFTSVTVFDLTAAEPSFSTRCFVGGSEAVYVSETSIYLATTRVPYQPRPGAWIYPAEMTTDLHRFTLPSARGGMPQYRASGVVEGHLGWDPLRKSYRLSEWNGHLRVLSYTGGMGWVSIADVDRTAASPGRLTVLRDEQGTLREVATLPSAQRPQPIGKPDEQIYGVRFAGPRGYVVTFREIDPLYVLDLSDPADPRIVGELEVPGVSEHLFPLDERWLLGVGRSVDAQGQAGGVQVTLFDVADPASPQARQTLNLGQAGSFSALDFSRQGLDWMDRDGVARIAMPLMLAGQPWSDWQQGLQRLEVDRNAGTLRSLPLLGAEPGYLHDLWVQRSLQIGDQIYFLRAGALETYGW